MKLSDVKGERVFDVIADVIDPIANISADKEAMKLFQRERLPEGRERNEFLAEKIKKGLPPLLRNHKNDVVKILATIEGVKPKDYAGSLNLVKLIRDCTDLLTDEAFSELFISAQTENSSGSVQENTEGHKA